MKTTSIIERLTILEKYRDKEGGFSSGADLGMIYAYPTDQPLLRGDLDRMIELGWVQSDTDYHNDESTNCEYAAKHYDIEESWWCHV